MDIVDAIDSESVPLAVKHLLVTLISEEPGVYSSTVILTPRDSNDDINGSQHASGGGTDFTYRDVTVDELAEATNFGVYDYFAREDDHYTGHSYHGEGYRFTAVVANPPAYAVSHSI